MDLILNHPKRINMFKINKPEWIVYMLNYRIGQSTTWYGALNILVIQEKLTKYEVKHYTNYVIVTSGNNSYHLSKER